MGVNPHDFESCASAIPPLRLLLNFIRVQCFKPFFASAGFQVFFPISSLLSSLESFDTYYLKRAVWSCCFF